jgi:exopolysaccharide biosynthesis polyprenyl glycosylphosphotransferase
MSTETIERQATRTPETEEAAHRPPDRAKLADELLRRLSGGGPLRGSTLIRYHGKRIAWTVVVGATKALKRAMDMVFAAAFLIALSPIFLTVAALIRLESPGGALFRQKRIGKWGRTFTMYKFRSMYADAEARKADLLHENEMQGGVIFKVKNDPRITKMGRFIRKTSIDELPQLWNVFKGDMSLVGPRPPVPQEVAEYSLSDRRRLDATPGITCVWQVSGRSEISFRDQVALDVAYIENQSFWGDVRILLQTIPAVLLGRGAY